MTEIFPDIILKILNFRKIQKKNLIFLNRCTR